MARRLLIFLVVLLVVANAVAFGARFFREDLEAAGLLPPSQLPTRADLPIQPLPAPGTDTVGEQASAGAPSADESDVVGEEQAPPAANDAPEQEPLASASSAAQDHQTPLGDRDSTTETPPVVDDGAALTDAPAPTPTPRPQTRGADGETAESTTCVHAGAFRHREPAVRASERLAAQGADVGVVVESVVGDPQYHVFVAPAANPAKAQRTARELTAEGVNSYVVTSGPRAGGVAVGVFHSEQRAEAQKDRVAQLGYDVRLAIAQQERQMYRVRAIGAPPSALAGIPHQPCPEAPAAAQEQPVADAPKSH